ncbi:hypothetical protein P7K49_028541, partial [Saguinus oedipus]
SDRDKALGSARRAEVSTGSCRGRLLAPGVFLQAQPDVQARTRTDRRSPLSPARARGVLRELQGGLPPRRFQRAAIRCSSPLENWISSGRIHNHS